MGNAPPTFAEAAKSEWEPENWPILIPRNVVENFLALDNQAGGWFRLQVEETDDLHANVQHYFGGSEERHWRLTAIDREVGRNSLAKLKRLSTLTGAPVATKRQIQSTLEATTKGVKRLIMIAYDVGQGNWNALADCSTCPQTPPRTVLFFDCGIPVGWKKHTAPPITFDPFAAALDDAPVVLSHWDMDHWAGAALGQPLYGTSSRGTSGIKINWHPKALSRKWIVPNQGKNSSRQKITPMAWRLALALHRRGNLMIWPASMKSVTTSGGHTVVRCQPAGSIKHNNNNSGLALIAKTPPTLGGNAFTLAPGDADYLSISTNFPALSGIAFTGLIASHHGGDIKSNPPVPSHQWSKLVFSHGNQYGHPTATSKNLHKSAGWTYQYETHTRKPTKQLGSTCLGEDHVAIQASLGNCLHCNAWTVTCPVK